MRMQGVDRQTQKLRVDGAEFLRTSCQSDELRRADRCKICGMGEKDHPFPLVILREIAFSHRCHRAEGRRPVSDQGHCRTCTAVLSRKTIFFHLFFCHGNSSCKCYCRRVQNSNRFRPTSSLNLRSTHPSRMRITISQVALIVASTRCPPNTLASTSAALICRCV